MTGTGLRDDTILGAIRLDWWAASDWNGARNAFGIPGRLRRNPHTNVVLLRKEAEIAPPREETLEQGARVVVAVLQDIVVGQSEVTGEEDALITRKAVHGRGRVVAGHQTVFEQVLVNGRHGALYPRIVRRQKAYQWQQ
jgi:hypothetical protein